VISGLLDALEIETGIIVIAALDLARGRALSDSDQQRVLEAKDRVGEIVARLRAETRLQ